MATEAELKAAAKKALAAGDTASAQRLIAAARQAAQQPQGFPALSQAYQAAIQPGGQPAPRKDADGVINSFLRGGLQGVMFGASDEILARVLSAHPRIDYDDALKFQRDKLAANREENPVASVVGEIAGSVALPFGALKTGGNLAVRTGKSMLAGATGGGAYGFNAGEGGVGARLDNAKDTALIGAGIGSMVPVAGSAIGRLMNGRAERQAVVAAGRNAPSTEDLRAMATSAYKAVDDAGVMLAPGAVRGMSDDIIAKMRAYGLDEGGGALSLTPDASRLAGVLDEAVPPGANGISFGEVEKLRRKAGVPAGSMKNKLDKSLGTRAISEIDDFIANLTPAQVVAGDASNVAANITRARDTYSRSSRSGLIENAMDAGEDYVSGVSSGIRNKFSSILKSPALSRGFSDVEKRAMRRVVNGGPIDHAINLVGSRLGQMATIGVGAGTGGFGGAIAGTAVAGGARKLSDILTTGRAEGVRKMIANGGLKEAPEALPPALRSLLERMMRSAGASTAVQVTR